MPLHDYDIANQAGAAFRADINGSLAAIVSQNSSLTAPTTTFAYQFWADTTADILKQRNAANTGWVSLYTLSTGKSFLAVLADTATNATTATKLTQGTQGYTLVAEQATTTGTLIDFTGIPSWATKIWVMFNGVSIAGGSGSGIIIQTGPAAAPETTGYLGSVADIATAGNTIARPTIGFGILPGADIAATFYGTAVLTLQNSASFRWACTSQMGRSDATSLAVGASVKACASQMSRLRVTTVNGTDTFDAGTISIAYE